MTFLLTLLATFAKNGLVKRAVRWQSKGRSAAERKSIPLCLIELADGIRRVKRLKHGIACHEHVGSCFFEV